MIEVIDKWQKRGSDCGKNANSGGECSLLRAAKRWTYEQQSATVFLFIIKDKCDYR